MAVNLDEWVELGDSIIDLRHVVAVAKERVESGHSVFAGFHVVAIYLAGGQVIQVPLSVAGDFIERFRATVDPQNIVGPSPAESRTSQFANPGPDSDTGRAGSKA